MESELFPFFIYILISIGVSIFGFYRGSITVLLLGLICLYFAQFDFFLLIIEMFNIDITGIIKFLLFTLPILTISVTFWVVYRYSEKKEMEYLKKKERDTQYQLVKNKKNYEKHTSIFMDIVYNNVQPAFFDKILFKNFCLKYKSLFINIDEIARNVIKNNEFNLDNDLNTFFKFLLTTEISSDELELIQKLKSILEYPKYTSIAMRKYIQLRILKDEYLYFKNKFEIVNKTNFVEQYCNLFKQGYNYSHVLFLYLLYSEIGEQIQFKTLTQKIEARQKQIQLSEFKKELLNLNNEHSLYDYNDLSGLEFEELIGHLYEKLGYNVRYTKRTGDQGVDIVATNHLEKLAIQVKRFSSSVGNSAIQEVVAGLNYYKCDKGIVVTNSNFTNSAIDLATENGILLINGTELGQLFKKVNF